jgi:nucleoside 2-deoxyribosyltransferase
MNIDIIGGSYREVCIDPVWREIYGSGLRAAHALSEFGIDIRLFTCIGEENYEELKAIANSIKVQLLPIICKESFTFLYEYPLASPTFHLPSKLEVFDDINSHDVLQFGLLEGSFIVNADRVIYDPQSPGNPRSFWENGSNTKELIWVANFQEVSAFAGSADIEVIRNVLFKNERVYAAVIKKGTDGAILIQKGLPDTIIPAFLTNKVWPIGTGDIFSAAFAYNYFCKGSNLVVSAIQASLLTAHYTNTTVLPLPKYIDEKQFVPFVKKSVKRKKVYLAGPFFNMAQRWLVEQFRNQLLNFGLEVFSPYHDIGLGCAEQVAMLDIAALNESDIVVAILDGLDSGTIFEIGYSRAKDIPVMVYTESEQSEALTMIQGTGCIIESDFSTIIYKTVWQVYK